MAGRTMLFRLREYDEAFRDVFSRVIRLHGEEAYPLLKEIPTEPRPAIHTSQVTLPSGEPLTNEPFEMKVAFGFNLSDMVSGNIDAFTVSAEASGREYGEQTMLQLLKYSGTISEAMGNAVAGDGRAFGWPVILEVLGGMEIDFEENGEPDSTRSMAVYIGQFRGLRHNPCHSSSARLALCPDKGPSRERTPRFGILTLLRAIPGVFRSCSKSGDS